MSDFFSKIVEALQSGAMSQLPRERQAGSDFGLTGASIQPSDLEDQLRNAQRKEAAIPILSRRINLLQVQNPKTRLAEAAREVARRFEDRSLAASIDDELEALRAFSKSKSRVDRMLGPRNVR